MTDLPSASFPVVFFNGDRDVDVGSVAVTPSIEFKKFQALIAQKIGVSPHQISISLIRRKKARSSPEICRKIAIDENTNFSAMSRERDCFVLVVMRRSRSGRRGRGRRGRHAGDGDEKSAAAAAVEIPAMTILKRNQNEEERFRIGSLGFWGYEAQLMNLQRMREKLLTSTAPYYPYTPSPAAVVRGGFGSPSVCEECAEAKRLGRSLEFHQCVYDEIVGVGFRSTAGPIERPTKRNVEATA